MQSTRHDFLKFVGISDLKTISNLDPPMDSTKNSSAFDFNFSLVPVSTSDELILPEGFEYNVLKSWKDEIAPGVKFGFNNDFTAFFSLSDKQALLWVNHEYIDPRYIPNIEEQKLSVGGSIFAIERISGSWKCSNDKALIARYNRRYDANSPMLITGPVKEKYPEVKGTLANCSGGKSLWGTVFSCEENYQDFIERYHWQDLNLEYYGWVVEIDPSDPNFKARKHSALGRFAHENATIALAASGQIVVYMGDDHENEHIYKFISKNKFITNASKEENSALLSEGTLYVAKLDTSTKGSWLELSIENPELKDRFADQADLLINTRNAAKILGASTFARPEDLEVNPQDGSVFVALTQNLSQNNYHGSIMKIKENNYTDLEFNYEEFVMGGEGIGLSCPDNLIFDDKGNLWVTTDIKGEYLNKEPYAYQGNNSLFVIPVQGENAGKAKRFMSAPPGAELTGTSFSDDFKTLFISVQHPGEDDAISLWPPDPNYNYPRPSVIAVSLSS